MFTAAFEILRAVDRQIAEIEAFTVFAFDFPGTAIKVVMHFVGVVAEAFGRWAYIFTG